jgi:hypothetical protein
MNPPRRLPGWLAAGLALAGLVVLYRGPLATGFLNDDYLFLEQARTRPLVESLGELGALGNYYRPLSRQAYFEALTPLAGGHPLVFHLANLALFAGVLALLLDLLLALVPLGAAIAGALYFAALPLQRVSLTWISCSQDLMALAGVLGAFALWRRGRTPAAALVALAGLASKEAALALPAGLAAWSLWIERRPAREALRRAAPIAAVAAAWAVVLLVMRARHALAAADLRFTPGGFAAGLAHGVQSLLGLDDPPGFAAALASSLPDLAALALVAALLPWIGRGGREAERPGGFPPARAALAFALAWIAAFALVTGPVAHTWSAYYYLPAAAGGAVLVALAARRLSRAGFALLAAVLLWWHAGGAAVRAFAVAPDPWGWTSHLTAFYFERGARLTADLARDLRAGDPAPPPGTRFFFATLPPWAGFQMGNGALVRALYRDASLESHFYSQFSESTAALHPCRFLYWDGDSLRPLYRGVSDPWFQVGSDLLLLERPRGAMHAFRRGLAEGGERRDHLYWLGWASLWAGRRDLAEDAWQALGARDDTTAWRTALRIAHTSLAELGDTLGARAALALAIQHGIGRPEAHAVLGPLLLPIQPKYGMLELKVATWLKPDDWLARRDLALALARARLDVAARREIDAYRAARPPGTDDREIDRADSLLRATSGEGLRVARF